MHSMKLVKIGVNDFDSLYPIMDEAFPYNEKRDYEGQKKLLENPRYEIYANEAHTVFIAAWNLEDFLFIEHFATAKEARGKGLGIQFLKQFLQEKELPVVLEVELPENEIAQRRIAFYERAGFFYHPFEYYQPPLRKDLGFLPLRLMSYPKKLTEKDFKYYKDKMMQHVYGVQAKPNGKRNK